MTAPAPTAADSVSVHCESAKVAEGLAEQQAARRSSGSW
jgi:hypothetical protein